MSHSPAAPGSRFAVIRWLLALLPLAAGAYLGYKAGYEMTLPELGVIGGVILLTLLGGAIVLVGVVGLVAMAASRAWLAKGALVTAGLLLVGGTGGFVSVGILGLGFHYPVILHGEGTATLAMTREDFKPVANGPASCDSVADGRAVDQVTALDLGDLGAGTLRAMVGAVPTNGVVSMNLYIDAVNLDPGAIQPMWSGQATVVEDSSGVSGTATFNELPAQVDPKSGASATGWPATLSGALTWRCQSWAPADATAAPPAAAQITIDMPGIPWSAPTGPASAVCEGGEVMGPAGSLQGYPFTANLILKSLTAARVGAVGDLSLTMDLGASKNPPPGLVYAPSWVGPVTVTVVGDGGRSGTATFTELPTGVDPAAGPAPTGWPTTISGMVSWTCAAAP